MSDACYACLASGIQGVMAKSYVTSGDGKIYIASVLRLMNAWEKALFEQGGDG